MKRKRKPGKLTTSELRERGHDVTDLLQRRAQTIERGRANKLPGYFSWAGCRPHPCLQTYSTP